MPLRTGRQGATLLEVLVAIFIMGIGLIALLVLFPVGALSMARAIQNERTAQASVSATAVANIANVRQDSLVYNPAAGVDFYLNPVPGVLPNASLENKSYPVFIDPIGYFAAVPLTAADSVGGVPVGLNLLLRRRPVSFVNPAAGDSYRWFTLMDDITFDKDGFAQRVFNNPNPPTMERDIRFSCAYLCQRPRTADVSIVDCQVVVFNSRPLALSGGLDLSEYAYYRVSGGVPEVTIDPGTNLVRIRYADAGGVFFQIPPPIRSGDWILDVSVTPIVGTFEPHGQFYRVAGVTEGADANGPYVDLETQQPLRNFKGVTTSAPGPNGLGRVLFLESVAEVFDRGVGKNP